MDMGMLQYVAVTVRVDFSVFVKMRMFMLVRPQGFMDFPYAVGKPENDEEPGSHFPAKIFDGFKAEKRRPQHDPGKTEDNRA